MKKTRLNFCLVIFFITVHDFFEKILSFKKYKKGLATHTDYPVKRIASFTAGNQVVIVDIVSEKPVGQLIQDYGATFLSKVKNEDTYFFIEDYFFDQSHFEMGEVYQVMSAQGPSDWKTFFWKLVPMETEGDSFLK